MQQIDPTRQLLLAFAEEYLRVPDVVIGNPHKVKAPYSLLLAWLAILAGPPTERDVLGIAFTGWLCGRDQFILHDECEQEFADILVGLCNEVTDVKGLFNDS